MADTQLNIVVRVINEAVEQLGKIAKQFEDLGENVASSNRATASGLADIAGTIGTIRGAAVRAGDAIKFVTGGWLAFKALQIPVHLAQAAGQAESLSKGLDAVGKSAGYSSGQLKEAVRQLEEVGITSTGAQRQLTRLITSEVGLGTGTELAKAAKNLANSLGRSTEEVFATIAQSVASGSTRLLRRQFGIVLNEQAVFTKKAQELGRELFPDERRQALAEAVTQVIADRFASADAADTLAARQDALRVSTDRLEESLGELLLPAMKSAVTLSKDLVEGLNFLVKSFHDGDEAADKMYKSTGLLADTMKLFRDIIRETTKFIETFGVEIAVVSAILTGAFLGSLLATTKAFRALVAGILFFTTPAVFMTNVVGVLTTALRALFLVVGGLPGIIIGATVAIYAFLKGTDSGRQILATAVTAVSRFVEILGKFRDLITGLGADIWTRITGKPKDAEEARKRFRQRIEDFLKDAKAAVEDISKAQAPPAPPKEEPKPGFQSKDFLDANEQATADLSLAETAERKTLREKREQEELKARLDARVKYFENVISITKTKNGELEVLDKQLLEQGRISQEEYFARRKKRAEDELSLEIQKAEAAVRVARQVEARIAKSDKPGGVEAINAEAARKAAETALENARLQKRLEITRLTVEETAKLEARGKAVRDARANVATSKDELDLGAALQVINNKYDDRIKALGVLIDVEDEAAIIAEKDLETAIKTADIKNKINQNSIDAQGRFLDAQRSQLDLEEKLGQLTGIEKTERENFIIEKRIQLEGQRIEFLQQQIALGALSDNQAREAVREIENRTKAITELALQVKSLGENLRRDFTGNLTTAIDSLITKTATLKEALQNLALSTLKTLSQAISQQLSEGIVKGISSTGIFGALGSSITGDSSGDRVQEQAAQQQKLAQERALMAEKALQDQTTLTQEAINDDLFLFEKQLQDESFLFQLEVAFQTFIAELGATLSANSAANAAGSVAGATAALGGYLRGASHAAGGININAEGGEYIINKRATKRWGPLLDAINFGGSVPNLGPRTRYAEGGQVMGAAPGDSKTEININIQDGEAKVSGNSDKAAQFAKGLSSMVQEEIIKQKRPGGLLFNDNNGR